MIPQLILSASRRTDIPAFYMDWFMARIKAGFFETVNPYNRKTAVVPATPERVHTIVFWSKNFGPFLDGGYGERLRQQGYHLFFNFTVNSAAPVLEPNLPALNLRMAQAAALCDTFGPETLSWRFDPICHYRLPDGSTADNLFDFPRLAGFMASIGVRRCITSFVDLYPKLRRRPKPYPEFAFIDPNIEQKILILNKMAEILRPSAIQLQVCCEREVLAALPPAADVTAAACIPGRLLASLFGGDLSFKKDAGQRAKQGCGCTVSTDIGIYGEQPCRHNCLFCYANPSAF